MNDIDQIAELSPISNAQASQLVSDDAHAGLIAAITARTDPAPGPRRTRTIRAIKKPAARRWLIAAPVVLGVAAAMLIASLVSRPGQHVGPINIGPLNAKAALTFTRHGQFIDVFVTNPYADQKKYDAEFKAHHLNVKLQLVAASPSLVDTVVYVGGDSKAFTIKVITAKGRCHTGGGGSQCPIGFRVPLSFRGEADVAFGRPAKPGEQYETSASAFAPGEALHGLHIIGHRVGAALAEMLTRQVTVVEYHHLIHGNFEKSTRKVPLNWFVYSAIPWSKGKVLLVVGKTRHQPVLPPSAPSPSSSSGSSSPGQPVPTPSPTRS